MNTLKFLKISGLGIALSSVLSFSAAEVSKTIEMDFDSSNELIVIQNLAGKLTVAPSNDSELHITGTVFAEADNDKQANKLLDSIKFDIDSKSNQEIISVVYPVDDFSGFIYNPNNNKSYWGGFSNTNTKYMGKRVKVASKAKGIFSNWAKVHTDLVIQLPVDQQSKIKLVSGEIQAANLDNSVTLDTNSGRITVLDSQGKLVADSGSGQVSVENFDGKVSADTGSGGIDLSNIKGDVDADTGSGGIVIEQVHGRVVADTGSGSVKVNDYLGGDLLEIDTGSGSVRVNGDLGNLDTLKIDTGSGSVVLLTSHVPSLDIDIETGSGGITVDLPDMNIKRDKRGDFEGTVGSGQGKAVIDTGSGSVKFRMDDSYTPTETSSNSISSEKKDVKEKSYKGEANPELAAKVRAALNKDKNIRDANITVSAIGNRAFISGTMDSVWDIAKAVKIVNDVEGVKKVSVDLELNED